MTAQKLETITLLGLGLLAFFAAGRFSVTGNESGLDGDGIMWVLPIIVMLVVLMHIIMAAFGVLS